MSDNIENARREIKKAEQQIFNGNKDGGYHISDAMSYLIKEIEELKIEISKINMEIKGEN